MDFAHVELTRNHRQNDPMLANIINHLGDCKPLTGAEVKTLVDHPCDVEGAVKLMPENKEVKAENDNSLNAPQGEEYRYNCLDDFQWRRDLHPELADMDERTNWGTLKHLRDHPHEEIVRLTVGARVMPRRDISTTKGLVNGSLGTMVRFQLVDPAEQPHDASLEGGFNRGVRYEQVRSFIEMRGYRGKQHTHVPVAKFDNIAEPVTIWPDCSVSERGFEEPRSLLMRTQIPLILAWAMTIHKAQGATLPKVIVDLSRCWEIIAYVGLSRVRSLWDMKVLHLGSSAINTTIADGVKDFMWRKCRVRLG